MKEKQLKVSVSGIRGVVGNGLDIETVIRYTRAFAKMLPPKSKIAIGRDTRNSGELFFHTVVATLMAKGHTAIDCGILPTPTLLYIANKLDLEGGIIITASHNPIEWNALKLVGKHGRFLNEAQMEELNVLFKESSPIGIRLDSIGKTLTYTEGVSEHVDEILLHVDSAAIRAKRFSVACDYVNGTGLVSTPILLSRLGAEEHAINNAITGMFAHSPEPSPKTMAPLSDLVLAKNADVGFTQDPDADRLALVAEDGTILSEEYTLALAAHYLWMKGQGDAVVNLSTSRMIDDVAKKKGYSVLRSKIGEINVSTVLREKGLYFAGEGNGGVIFPTISPGRDSLVAIAFILDLMAMTGKKITELVAEIPAYVIIKEKIEAAGVDTSALYTKIRAAFPEGEYNDIDGLKVDLPEGWVHARPSNTEPVIRIIAEAKTDADAKHMIERVRACL